MADYNVALWRGHQRVCAECAANDCDPPWSHPKYGGGLPPWIDPRFAASPSTKAMQMEILRLITDIAAGWAEHGIAPNRHSPCVRCVRLSNAQERYGHGPGKISPAMADSPFCEPCCVIDRQERATRERLKQEAEEARMDRRRPA